MRQSDGHWYRPRLAMTQRSTSRRGQPADAHNEVQQRRLASAAAKSWYQTPRASSIDTLKPSPSRQTAGARHAMSEPVPALVHLPVRARYRDEILTAESVSVTSRECVAINFSASVTQIHLNVGCKRGIPD